MKQQPSVNRAVHYYCEPNSKDEAFSGPYAAIITGLDPVEPNPGQ